MQDVVYGKCNPGRNEAVIRLAGRELVMDRQPASDCSVLGTGNRPCFARVDARTNRVERGSSRREVLRVHVLATGEKSRMPDSLQKRGGLIEAAVSRRQY
jgi:hypothetical protein